MVAPRIPTPKAAAHMPMGIAVGRSVWEMGRGWGVALVGGRSGERPGAVPGTWDCSVVACGGRDVVCGVNLQIMGVHGS